MLFSSPFQTNYDISSTVFQTVQKPILSHSIWPHSRTFYSATTCHPKWILDGDCTPNNET